jgi:hypothetical protein
MRAGQGLITAAARALRLHGGRAVVLGRADRHRALRLPAGEHILLMAAPRTGKGGGPAC